MTEVFETCASSYSFDCLPWRRVAVRAPPAVTRQQAKLGKDAGLSEGGIAGGFGYRDSALPSSTCRNRFILWQCREGSLRLWEVSLDIHLVHNALQLDFEGGNSSTSLLPDVSVHEYDSSSMVVLFATSAAVYRLILPHPAAIVKTPNLMSRGEGLMPSVLAFASEQNFIGPNMATVSDQPGSVVVVTSSASCISSSGQVTFALSSPSGSVHLIQLPPPGVSSLPVRSVLRASSMMTKLWSSLMPAAMKGNSEAEDAPVSITLHLFDGMEIALVLCRDLNLRIWSCQMSQCVMTHSLASYLQIEEDTTVKEDRLLLRKAPGGTDTSLRFAVHVRIGGYSQISIFQLFLINSQLVLRPMNNYCCPMNSSLVDFSLTNREVFGVWVCRDGAGEGEETVAMKAVYDDPIPGTWQTVQLLPDPPSEVTVLQQHDPREAYLKAIFHPGRFSSAAIRRTLELYGASEVEDDQLEALTTIKVEAELQASAESQELTHDDYRDLCMKCWTKFYGCCHEYHKLLSQPVGLFQDPGTGMGLILKQGMASFIRPDEFVSPNDARESEELKQFMKCVKELAGSVNDDVLDSFLIEMGYQVHPPPITMAMDIAAALHEEGGDTALPSKLSSINIATALDSLVKALDQSSKESDNSSTEEGGMEYQYQTVSSQLFASPVATAIVGSTLQEVCHSRMLLCRDLLILLCVLKYSRIREVPPTLSSVYIPKVACLLQNYHSLHWLTTQTPLQPISTTYEANLKQLASLEISSQGTTSRHVIPSGYDSTLAKLYLSAGGHHDLSSELIRRRVLPSSPHPHPHWSALLPKIINILLTKLWPMTSSCNVGRFLLVTSQYTYLQEYLSLTSLYVKSTPFSRAFLLGHAHLSVGDLEKALSCFVQAAGGVGDDSETLLQCVCGGEAGEDGEGSDDGDDGRMVQYFIKVMRLFEHVPSPSYVVRVTEVATNLVNRKYPNASVLWSNLFKYHLELGHSQGAYLAMMDNPDPVRKRDCLRRLVIVLTERKKLQELCEFKYPGMEEEVEKTIELRARSVDVTKHGYYNLLYCFHVCRGNYRKAAYAMYEYGLRLGRESPDPKSLQKQANCYAITLSALSLTESKYAWVIKPVEPDEPPKMSRRKRIHSSQKGSEKRHVEVLTIADLQKEYLLVKAKLRLLKKDPSLETQLSSPFVSADEVTSLLAQAGLFEMALDVADRFSLSTAPVFEALTARCVHLSTALRQANGDVSVYWDWLGLNESTQVTTARENSVATKAWNLLRCQLEKSSQSVTLQRCVARKLITMGAQLPQWLMDRYKRSNPAELLKMYITFDLLEPATKLAIEFIDAVCGHGKEFFGLHDALHANSPSVWLPYSTLDHLSQALQSASLHPSLCELAEKFSSKIQKYFQMVDDVSMAMKKEAWLRSAAAASPRGAISYGDIEEREEDGSPEWSMSSGSMSDDEDEGT